METFLMGAVSTQSGMTLPRPMRTPLRSVYLGPVFQSSLRGTRSQDSFLVREGAQDDCGLALRPRRARGDVHGKRLLGCRDPGIAEKTGGSREQVTRTVFDECNIASSWGCGCD